MEDIGLQTLGITIAVCLIVGLLIGYLIGHFLGGGKSGAKAAAAQAAKAHEAYRDDVREHFEQTSHIMSRMVDDYREMYEHMSAGAGKLANIHPERVVTPPPAPEAITEQEAKHGPAGEVGDTATSQAKSTAAETSDDDDAPERTSADKATEDDKARARRLSGNPA